MTNSAECAKCNDKYFSETTKCTKCPEGCKTCKSATDCESKCLTGYFGVKCIKCAADCAECTEENKCTKDKCNKGFSYIEASKTCATTVVCAKGEYKDTAKNTCVKCGTDCLECAGADACTKCKVQYGQDGASANKCKKCTTVSDGLDNCGTDGATVKTCIDGYGVIATKCAKCIGNCADCTAATTCDKCMAGYNFT